MKEIRAMESNVDFSNFNHLKVVFGFHCDKIEEISIYDNSAVLEQGPVWDLAPPLV